MNRHPEMGLIVFSVAVLAAVIGGAMGVFLKNEASAAQIQDAYDRGFGAGVEYQTYFCTDDVEHP